MSQPQGITDGTPCPRCAGTRTWWLPRMGEYLPAFWCVACSRTFRPRRIVQVTAQQRGLWEGMR